jgi:hypothetical protein
MHRHWAPITLTLTLFSLVFASAQSRSYGSTSPVQEKQQKSEAKAGESSLTGCVDEQDGHYVLVDDRTLTPIADLAASGFPTEGFAKHLGHKVTVRGTPNSGAERPLFKVRSIQPVSESCVPQHQ